MRTALIVLLLLLGVVPATAETAWFIVPYDTPVDRPGKLARVCAIARYLPTLPRGDRSEWACSDIRQGYAVAKVITTPATMATMRADPDFHEVTTTIAPATITRLTTLGYTAPELTGTRDAVLTNVMAVRSKIVGVSAGVVIYGATEPSAATPDRLDALVRERP